MLDMQRCCLALEGGHQIWLPEKWLRAAVCISKTNRSAWLKPYCRPKDADAPILRSTQILIDLERSYQSSLAQRSVLKTKMVEENSVIQYSDLDVLDGILGRMQ